MNMTKVLLYITESVPNGPKFVASVATQVESQQVRTTKEQAKMWFKMRMT